MRPLPLAMGLLILGGCAGTPEPIHTRELVRIVCPPEPPVVMCDGWRPDYWPTQTRELQAEYVERGAGLDCRDKLIGAWEESWTACHRPQ